MSEEKKSPVFARQATGLVRDVGGWSTFFFTNAAMSTGLTILFVLYDLYLFPGGSPILASIIAGIGFIAQALTYWMLSQTMPRSAGEYVFVSRGLNAPLGVASGFSKLMWSFLWTGIYASWTTTIGASPALGAWGAALNDQTLLNMSVAAAQPFWTITIGVVIILAYALLMIVGTRHAFRFVNLLIIVGYLGLFSAIGLLAASNPTSFASAFNSFSARTINNSAYFSTILSTGQQGGVTSVPFSWVATLGLVPIAAFAFIAIGDQTAFAGEIRSVRRNSFIGILGSLFFGIFVFVLASTVFINAVGYNFAASIGYASGTGNYTLPVLPYFNFLSMVLTNNVILLLFISLGYIAWNLSIVPWGFFNISRFTLGLSFDRIFPSMFSDVSERFHTPVKAILLAVVGGIIALVLINYSYLTFLSLTLGQILTQWGLVALAGIVLPFKMRNLFASSPAGRKIGGVPVITLTSILTVIWLVFIAYSYMTNSAYAAWNQTSAYLIVGVFTTGLIIYFVAKFYRERRGIPLGMAFKEIPPE